MDSRHPGGALRSEEQVSKFEAKNPDYDTKSCVLTVLVFFGSSNFWVHSHWPPFPKLFRYLPHRNLDIFQVN